MKYSLEIRIEKPIETVWAFYDNPDNLKLWLSGFKAFVPLEGPRGEPGSTAQHIYENNGREMIFTETIRTRVAHQEFTGDIRHETMDMFIENYFSSTKEGHTLLKAHIKVRFKSILFKIMGPIMKNGFVKRQRKDFERLKAAIEGQVIEQNS